jgi:hypothetical protein
VTYEHADTSLPGGTYPAANLRPVMFGAIRGNMAVAVATGGTSKTANLTVTNISAGNAVKVNWGDGTADSTVSGGTATHVYATAGVKPIVLTSTDGEQVVTSFTSV